MIKIKAIRLKNFCGYKDNQFIFATKKGVNDISVIFGSNGCGKSSILDAIRILSSPKELIGRDIKTVLRRYIYNEDYDPAYQAIKIKEGLVHEEDMEIEGVFETEEGIEKRVFIEASKKRNEIIINELIDIKKGKDKDKNENTFSYYIDADNPINMNKFSLPDDYSDSFLDMAEAIYGYSCILASSVQESDDEENVVLHDDFIIVKNRNKNEVKVHFKRMSAGEKKIATLLRYLYNPTYIDNINIILIDNLDLHLYYKRHKPLIDKLLKHFSDKQFIITAHSETMINHIKDIRGNSHLFDLEQIHNGNINIL